MLETELKEVYLVLGGIGFGLIIIVWAAIDMWRMKRKTSNRRGSAMTD